jgi:ubiquinone/menaquinone biosynthesis C-methylase UbiE
VTRPVSSAEPEPPIARSLAFDRVAETYDETRGGEPRGRRFAPEVARFLDPSKPVLEIGVGTGVMALGLRELGFDVLGVDLSLPMLRAAARRNGPRVAAGDARRLPFPEGSFDQAYSVWVLHVVGDMPGVLREVGRILRPGGRYVVVPAVGDSPADPIGAAIRTMQRGLDPKGLRDDGEARLRALAPAAGLRVVERHTWALHDYDESPAEALRKIESRSYSILWDVTEEEWERFVVPAIETLRSLPDPDRPLERQSTNELLVLERVS